MLEVKILEVSVTQMGFAIVLQPPGKKKVVPIFIGPLETYSISSAIENQKSERPMTHDLIKTILVSLDYKVSKVLINNFRNGTFFARLFFSGSSDEKDVIEVDARPSDSIALAVRFGAPIYMDDAVYDKVSVDIDLIKDKKGDDEKNAYFDENESLAEEFHDENLDNEIIQTILEEFSDGAPAKPYTTPKPSQSFVDEFKSKKEVLEQMLKIAVKKENYEEAAKIRDEIKKVGKEAQLFSYKPQPVEKQQDSADQKMD